MSLYREGQRVIFVLPTVNLRETNGTITQVLQDSDLGDQRDLYSVLIDSDQRTHPGITFSIRNENVVDTINEAPQPVPIPTFTNSGQIRYITSTNNDSFRWEIPTPESSFFSSFGSSGNELERT